MPDGGVHSRRAIWIGSSRVVVRGAIGVIVRPLPALSCLVVHRLFAPQRYVLRTRLATVGCRVLCVCCTPYLRLHRDARIDGREKHGDCVFYVGVLSLSSFLHTFLCGFSGRGVHQIMLLVGGKSFALKLVTTVCCMVFCFVVALHDL